MKPADIKADRSEALLPDDRRTAEAFSRLGYSLTDSLADLIDNSIDAGASKVLVRLVRSDERVLRIVIADNGSGMDDEILSEAMRFGTRNEKTGKQLGKYGIGLKTASFGQARSVTVLSKQGSKCVGRRWTQANIARGWLCDVLESNLVADYLKSARHGPVSKAKSGTAVIWEELEHLRTNASTIEASLAKVFKDICCGLGLRFHRFITSNKLSIYVDVQMANELDLVDPAPIEPLDPFDYPETGKDGYPKAFKIDLNGALTLDCHIWPAKSSEKGYKLGGGKVSARQGFYFYRNDRLIQAGGWNGCREDDSEPHLSLARVRIDLPPAMDSMFSLDVKKTKVEPPPDFPKMVSAVAGRTGSFKEYLIDADQVYRKHKKVEKALFKFIPGRGFPAIARNAVKRALFAQGTGRATKIAFKWADLDPDEFVRVDREQSAVLLNEAYRSLALDGKRASGTDAPFMKLLLLMLFQSEFDRRASSEQYREWARRINAAMIQTLKKAS